MKKTIAKKTLIPIAALFMLFTCICFVLSYQFILRFINEERTSSLESIAVDFSFHMQKEAEEGHLSTEDELKSFLQDYGDDIVESFGLDYVSSFIPHFEQVEIEYLTVSNSKALDSDPAVLEAKNSTSPIARTYISDEFRLVWSGEKEISTIEYSNEYGHELCSFVRVTAPYGQDVIVTFEASVEDNYKAAIKLFRELAIVVGGMYLVSFLVFYLSLKRNVSTPARAVSKAMTRFITDGSRSSIRLDENVNGEFGSISRAFNDMAENIDTYIADISALKSQEERQKTEMEIAQKIQTGFLPQPKAYFGGCDICATMKPARQIGGDLYDYLQLDDDRMLVMIADVSGKGVSAAIFMVATTVLMHQYAKMNLGPAEILKRTNASLAEKNPLLLFATAFVGIYDNRTLEFTYSNAGHNLPYLLRGGVKPLGGSSGTLLGLFENEEYAQSTVKLAPGDILYLYTDGVNESTNKNNEFYGREKLEWLLGQYKPSFSESLVDYVCGALAEFAQGAGQSDDITMLALTAKAKKDVRLRPNTREFPKIKELILESGIPEENKLPLCLCAEEIFVNICSYAFGDEVPEEECVQVSLSLSDHTELRFEDGGVPYDPRTQVTTIEEYDVDAQIGGLGKLIAFSIADDVRYEYTQKKNILTLIKY